MIFFTFCHNINHPKLKLLIKSAERNGISVNVLGAGITWQRNFQKVRMLKEAVDLLDPEEIIVATDAFDVIYLAGAEELEVLFRKMSSSIIFAAEKWNSFHYQESILHFEKIAPPSCSYKFLNSGTFMGNVTEIKKMLDYMLKTTTKYQGKSDQRIYGKYATDHPEQVKLDYQCQIFWCTAGEWDAMEEIALITDKRRILNKITNTKPALIHVRQSKVLCLI